jgi:flagellar biosynthesis protein FlhA
MTVTESLQRFTLLSIGDGLVSQIPALIVSMAAGMLVTRAASKNSLGQELGKQLLFYPRALMILTGMLAVFALVPGLPMFPFLMLAIVSGFLARELKKRSRSRKPPAGRSRPARPKGGKADCGRNSATPPPRRRGAEKLNPSSTWMHSRSNSVTAS